MMVGAVLYLLHPSSIWLHIAVSAVIDLVFHPKEGWTTKKARITSERSAWFQCATNGIIGSWEAHLPSKHSLLTSL